jgi:DNA segregation ATPase FtsK/SpoIIIE, S-DNA-T family
MDSKLGRRHEIIGILCLSVALLCGLALFSYDQRGGENWIGRAGEGLGSALASSFGWAAYFVPVELLLAAFYCFRQRPALAAIAHAASVLVFVLLGCALLHLSFHGTSAFGGHPAGGVLGEVLGEVLRSLLGLAGAYVVCGAALLITFILRTSFSFIGFMRRSSTFAAQRYSGMHKTLSRAGHQLSTAWGTAQAIERRSRNPPARKRHARPPRLDKPEKGEKTGRTKSEPLRLLADTQAERPRSARDRQAADPSLSDDATDPEIELDEHDAILLEEGEAQGEVLEPIGSAQGDVQGRKRPSKAPIIVAPTIEQRRRPSTAPEPIAAYGGKFVLPPTTLLTDAPHNNVELDRTSLNENAERLVEKLAAYGVRGRVDAIQPGPVVTMYEFEPQSGTKISKIAGLSDDLAMALAAQKVRIVAPIPGKARVGFELPNEARETVYLRELLEDERWHALQWPLPLAFGKDITGQPVYGDLSKMPHLLVAGATGSGKSVGLNVMLASLLMKKSPDDVRLLMIDPKVVELAVFDGIPHMLLPVVTDMKKASLALRWAVDEMERRYQLFADAGARNLITYNQRVDRVLSGELSVAAFAPRRAGKVRAIGAQGEELLLDPSEGERPDAEDFQPQRLPSIVLVVDEFADLMMVAAKDVESAIARLAQKARAAGIHVILATQRPSVDVITGMIKANFPSRIAYKVSQREDSKTILGRTGAEHLLGLGDMLTLLPGSNDLKRVHSAYISEDEVKGVCDFLRAQGVPVYDDDILKPRDDEDDPDMVGALATDDPLYDRAVAIVAQAGYCSISHIQRNLNVGYNKAAKLVERMEKEGVVGPASGKAGGRREVFIEAR